MPEHVYAFERWAKAAGKSAHVHIKLDTGMHRIGVTDDQMLSDLLDAFDACPHVSMDGVFTHFAKSEADPAFTHLQAQRFDAFVAQIHARGYRPIVHAANSAATLDFPELQYDMVRYGIALYGCHPDAKRTEESGLTPVMSLITYISNLKTISAGEGVSYGLRFIASRPTRVATLPIGYGDGYKRCLTGKADVLIGGIRCPQIGTICMDQMMVDVSEVPNVAIGDEAVLIGRQGNEKITADELAEKADTISYEILLSFLDRVPRVYEK
jgi:alanine racemase